MLKFIISFILDVGFSDIFDIRLIDGNIEYYIFDG